MNLALVICSLLIYSIWNEAALFCTRAVRKQGYSSERSGGARRVLACSVRLDLKGSRWKPNLFDLFIDTSRVTTKLLSNNVYQYHLLLAFREVYQHFQRSVSSAGRKHLGSLRAFESRHLGSSSLEVTEPCLGTMTWGVQNNEEEAHEQLDYAVKE